MCHDQLQELDHLRGCGLLILMQATALVERIKPAAKRTSGRGDVGAFGFRARWFSTSRGRELHPPDPRLPQPMVLHQNCGIRD